MLLTVATAQFPTHNQQCAGDKGPRYEEGEQYHDYKRAEPKLLADGTCADPLKGACG